MPTAVHPGIHNCLRRTIASGSILTIGAGIIVGDSFPRSALLDQIITLSIEGVMTEIIVLTHVRSLVASGTSKSLRADQWVEAATRSFLVD